MVEDQSRIATHRTPGHHHTGQPEGPQQPPLAPGVRLWMGVNHQVTNTQPQLP